MTARDMLTTVLPVLGFSVSLDRDAIYRALWIPGTTKSDMKAHVKAWALKTAAKHPDASMTARVTAKLAEDTCANTVANRCVELRQWQQFTFRDPFAGDISEWGHTIEEAVEAAYEDISEDERPAHVYYHGTEIVVPGGRCHRL